MTDIYMYVHTYIIVRVVSGLLALVLMCSAIIYVMYICSIKIIVIEYNSHVLHSKGQCVYPHSKSLMDYGIRLAFLIVDYK